MHTPPGPQKSTAIRPPTAVTLALCAALGGCVLGSGPCLLQEPIKTHLSGTLHFRSYPSNDGIDHVTILALDKTAYIYAPALSHQCAPANDLQLVGWSEFPPELPENAHVRVEGSVFEAASAHQHTSFLMNVHNILRIGPAPGASPTSNDPAAPVVQPTPKPVPPAGPTP